MPNLENKYKRSKIIFSVTDHAYSNVNIFVELLQLFLQSLVGSPSTLSRGAYMLILQSVYVPSHVLFLFAHRKHGDPASRDRHRL